MMIKIGWIMFVFMSGLGLLYYILSIIERRRVDKIWKKRKD